MRLLVGVLVAFLVSCAPSLSEQRVQLVVSTRADARARPGARQAAAFAEAIHGAYRAGDYKAQPQALHADATEAIGVLDRATPNAGPDAPTLVAWRALMLTDLGRIDESLAEFQRSFALAPNALAGRNLIVIYGAANLPDKVGELCRATVDAVSSDDDKLDVIALCRTNMNAASPDGEMAWMPPALVTWYQAENARRLGAEIDAENAQAEQQRHEQRVVRQTEQCAAVCKERGLTCENDCNGDQTCEDRCVDWNHACLDRCESAAYEKLGQ